MKWLALASIATVIVFAAGCTSLSFLIANSATLTGRYDRSTNHAYGPDPRQQLDVYSPKDAKDRPVVVFFHGGSWTEGRRGLYRFVGAALAERGIVTVLPDYRLYPQVEFPVLIDDGALALAWVQQHAQEFGGDPRRIVLMGHSAGGHEAAFLAYDRQLLQKVGVHPEWIVGFVGLSGPYALEPNSKVLNTIFANPYTEADWQPVRFVTRRLRQRCSCTVPPMMSSRSSTPSFATRCRPVTCGSNAVLSGQRTRRYCRGLFRAGAGTHAVLDQSVSFIESVTLRRARTRLRPRRPPDDRQQHPWATSRQASSGGLISGNSCGFIHM